MNTGIRIGAAAALFAAASLACGVALGADGAPSPPSSTGIFPLSQVRAGQIGQAYTVFQGVQPEAMGVEVLGVLKNALGPGHDMILVRLTGAKPEYTGVVAGMSGSPVYIDGKLAGALSYQIGQFSKEPIAGVTPIADMLEAGAQTASQSTPLSPTGLGGSLQGTVLGAMATVSLPEANLSTRANNASPAIVPATILPMETPLVFAGFSAKAVELFGDRFRAAGLTPAAGLGGFGGSEPELSPGAGHGPGGNPRPLIPGDAVSALIVKGDLEIAATCTATYVSAREVLACGHPITQFGPVSIPMAEASVVATVPSLQTAFKVIQTGRTIGAFTEDRASAVRGTIGEPAKTIPMSIHVQGAGWDKTFHLQVIDNPDITPAAVMVSLYQCLFQSDRYGAELTYSLHGQVSIAGYPGLRIDSLSAPTDEMPSAMLASLTLGNGFSAIYGSPARLRHITAIDVEVRALTGRRSVELDSAELTQPSARAGEIVTVEAALRPFRGPVKDLHIPVRIPATFKPGPLRILLSDGATLDHLTAGQPGVQPPSDLNSLIHQLNAERADDRLYVSLLLPYPQAVVDGRTLPSIPLSMANVLQTLRANKEMSLTGESVVPVTSIPVNAALSGQQIVSVDVK